MVGNGDADIARLMPIFDALRPAGEVADGFVHAGPVGAGHYAKMVHNGDQYGLMRLRRRLRTAAGRTVDPADTQAVIRPGPTEPSCGHGCRNCWPGTQEDPDLADISDYTEDSGEGRWTVEEAINHRVPTPVIAASLFARSLPRQERSPTIRAVSALHSQFGSHAVKRPTVRLAPYVRHLALHATSGRGRLSMELTPPDGLRQPQQLGKTDLGEALWYCAASAHTRSPPTPCQGRGGTRSGLDDHVVTTVGNWPSTWRSPPAGANKARLNQSPVPQHPQIPWVQCARTLLPEDLARPRRPRRTAPLSRRAGDGPPADHRRRARRLRQGAPPAHRTAEVGGRSPDAARRRCSGNPDVWDGHLAAHGARLMAARQELVDQLEPEVRRRINSWRRGPGRPASPHRTSIAATGAEAGDADFGGGVAGGAGAAARRRAGPRCVSGGSAPR